MLFHTPNEMAFMLMENSSDKSSPQNYIGQPPHPVLERYYADEVERRLLINQLFDRSARYYDGISQAMVFGSGLMYRRKTLLNAGLTPGMNILDVGCGTGLISFAASKVVGSKGLVVGVDPSLGMIKEGVQRNQIRHSARGMAEHLPINDNSFDFVCMGYALRHVFDLERMFSEFWRVLKPGGILLILEITRPQSKIFYNFLKLYLKNIVPTLTKWVTRNMHAQSVMSYHWDTIDQCVSPETIITAMRKIGFAQIERNANLGVFSEYKAKKI